MQIGVAEHDFRARRRGVDLVDVVLRDIVAGDVEDIELGAAAADHVLDRGLIRRIETFDALTLKRLCVIAHIGEVLRDEAQLEAERLQ